MRGGDVYRPSHPGGAGEREPLFDWVQVIDDLGNEATGPAHDG